MDSETIYSVSYIITCLVFFLFSHKIAEDVQGKKETETGQFVKLLVSIAWPFILVLGFLYGKSEHDNSREIAIAWTVMCLASFGLSAVFLHLVF